MFSKVYFLQQRYENNLAHSVRFLVVKQLSYVHYELWKYREIIMQKKTIFKEGLLAFLSLASTLFESLEIPGKSRDFFKKSLESRDFKKSGNWHY